MARTGSQSATIHVIADLHFGGSCAHHAHPHGFADITERTRRICETWRARVAPIDTVWILGNVGNAVHLADLPGIKHLVRAAHDPQPWNCLATGRYASVGEARMLQTPQGAFLLASDPFGTAIEDGIVLHGHGAFSQPGYLCVSAEVTGWGPLSLDEIARRVAGEVTDSGALAASLQRAA